MGVHAVEQDASQEGSSNISRRASDKDVGDVADVLFHIHSQVAEGRAEN